MTASSTNTFARKKNWVQKFTVTVTGTSKATRRRIRGQKERGIFNYFCLSKVKSQYCKRLLAPPSQNSLPPALLHESPSDLGVSGDLSGPGQSKVLAKSIQNNIFIHVKKQYTECKMKILSLLCPNAPKLTLRFALENKLGFQSPDKNHLQ